MADRRPHASVRARVTLATTAAVGVVLVLVAIAVAAHQRAQLTDGVDQALALRADDVEADLVAGQLGDSPAAATAGDPGLVQVVDDRGTVVAASANVAGEAPVAAGPPAGTEVVVDVDDLPVDDDRYRLLSRGVATPDGTVAIHVAASADPLDESLDALRSALVVGIPVLLAAVAVATWVGVGRALRPMEQIRAEVAGLSGDETSHRVAVPPGRDEVARLAATMNSMLERLDAAAERQRRFVADASHELRSPLTRMRTDLEVDLAHPDAADPLATHRRVLADLDELQSLVRDLLALAEAGATAAPPATEVDLDDVVLEEVARARAIDGVALDASGVSAAQVLGDPRQLRRAVGNLVDNALRHADAEVRITLGEREGWATLAVADDGPGVPEGAEARIFERFGRAGEGGDGGAGLGLAIVEEIARVHGGTVALDRPRAGGARFVLRLPLAASDGSAS